MLMYLVEFHDISDAPQAVDLHMHHVFILQEDRIFHSGHDSGRGASHNQRARLQGSTLATEGHELLDSK